MDEQNVEYPIMEYSLLSNEKEQTTDTCYNTDEPQKHYAKERMKVYKTIRFHLCEIFQKGKTIDTESRSVVA